MAYQFQKLPEHSELNELMQRAVNRKMTAEEIIQQRISWVYGNLPHDSKITRKQVEARVRSGDHRICPERPRRGGVDGI